MIFRLYYRLAGGHVHCRLFAGKHDGALGKCGDLTMRVDEFVVFVARGVLEFREENPASEKDFMLLGSPDAVYVAFARLSHLRQGWALQSLRRLPDGAGWDVSLHHPGPVTGERRGFIAAAPGRTIAEALVAAIHLASTIANEEPTQ